MERNQNFNEDERCDDERKVFNARLNEDEMIITIAEYQDMKKGLEYFKCQIKEREDLQQELRGENLELRTRVEQLKKENEECYLKFRKVDEERQQIRLKLDTVYNENLKLKRGIVNFIKGLGG